MLTVTSTTTGDELFIVSDRLTCHEPPCDSSETWRPICASPAAQPGVRVWPTAGLSGLKDDVEERHLGLGSVPISGSPSLHRRFSAKGSYLRDSRSRRNLVPQLGCRSTHDLTISEIMAWLKAGMSLGPRLVMSPRSTTTSSSTHLAPAFLRSVCRLG
jgi:hypothetical protein